MPISLALTPRHREPTITVPATRRNVHAVPFAARSRPAASQPPSLPPNSPIRNHSNAAYDPINMIPSSSTSPPKILGQAAARVTAIRFAPPPPTLDIPMADA